MGKLTGRVKQAAREGKAAADKTEAKARKGTRKADRAV